VYRYSFDSDVWAMGITMYEVITLHNPYEGMTTLEIKSSLKSDKYPQICLEEIKGYY
jgi:serine/threonine protein kinase